jgi:hypothetical protein
MSIKKERNKNKFLKMNLETFFVVDAVDVSELILSVSID